MNVASMDGLVQATNNAAIMPVLAGLLTGSSAYLSYHEDTLEGITALRVHAQAPVALAPLNWTSFEDRAASQEHCE